MGAVSYLNTLPLIKGLEQSPLFKQVELSLDYPSAVAEMLKSGAIDLGLVPVAMLAALPGARIVSHYGIAADGPVASVCLFSRVPLSEVQEVLLDYQSRTSVALVSLLMQHYWKKEVAWKAAAPGYEALIDGHTAGVIIGDRALALQQSNYYIYDLAEAWKAWTGLPFVFAAWVALRELPGEFLKTFDAAMKAGLEKTDDIIAATPFPGYDLGIYFRQNISYYLSDEKMKGLNYFLSLLPRVAGVSATI